MPAEKNKLARVLVPIVVVAVAAAAVWSFSRTSTPRTGGAGAGAGPGAEAAQALQSTAGTNTPSVSAEQAGGEGAAGAGEAPKAGAAPVEAGAAPSVSAAEPEVAAKPAAAAAPGSFSAKKVGLPAGPLADIGSVDPAMGFKSHYTFTHLGAGVETVTLAEHYETLRDKIKNETRFQVQQRLGTVGRAGESVASASLAARAVIINGVAVDLFGDAENNYWVQSAPGVFSAEIVDGAGATVARITRKYELELGSYEVKVRQSFENVSGAELNIQWVQYGPVDIIEEMYGYRIDMRRIRYGYLLEPNRDPSQSIVEADGKLEGHAAPIAAADAAFQKTQNPADRYAMLFPRTADFKGAGDLVWVAQTSRYFTFAVHPLLEGAGAPVTRFALASEVYGVPIGWATDARLVLELHSAPFVVKPGTLQDLSFAAYAGPLAKSYLSAKADPHFGTLGLSKLVVFNLGGCWCLMLCTFQWLAELLLMYLELVHRVLGDWTLAIIILVLTVRSILHPVTRKAQINMTRFGKKMAALAPKQKKIQEQYAGDPKQMQIEMARLMREEGVSPTQALGCLPTFLQTPVWMAVYAMLYFAFQFRHQQGFYGLFQAVSGGTWSFMADLSAPDHFWEFGRTFNIPLVSGLMGGISGVNLLPLVLGVVFYIQQKYLAPPTTGTMTPEQEMQQKMMKVMMVVMFPVMMYNAPSGLAVYFITNSVLGIIESRWIRAHIDELDKNPPPEKKPGSGWGRKKVENQAASPFAKEREQRRFKDR